jgi:hypothetical protein
MYRAAPSAILICLSIAVFFQRSQMTLMSWDEVSNVLLSRSKNRKTWFSKTAIKSQSSLPSHLKGFA